MQFKSLNHFGVLARVAMFALLTMLFGAVLALGQTETGTLVGTVTDPSGASVPNAQVTLKNVGNNQTRTLQTNARGEYTFTNIEPGNYQVTVDAAGFSKTQGNINVSVGGRPTFDAKLQVGGSSQTVEVTADLGGAQVNTQDQSLSGVVNTTQIEQLPTLNRDPYGLVGTVGNVGSDPNGSTGRGVGVAINGQRAASTDVLLDGGENVDLFGAGVGQTVPLDSVQEFRVITSGFTAEYGRASGGIVNVVTKSGTNAFHGSAYEFNRNSAYASNTYNEAATNFANTKVYGTPRLPHDRFNRNQFGYSLGGPVLRDKLFFFSSTEWTRVRSAGQQFAYVLDPGFIALTAPNSQQFFSTFGKSLLPGAKVVGNATPAGYKAPGLTGPVFDLVSYTLPSDAGAGSPQNTYSTVNRVDLNLTSNTTLFGRYGLQSTNFFPGTNASSPYAGYNTGSTNYNQNALFNLTHIFGPSVINQFKVEFNRLNNQQPLNSGQIGPTLYLARGNTATQLNGQLVALPGYLPFSPGNAIPFGGPQNLYEFFDDLSVTKGSHQLRFGGYYIHIRDNRVFGAYETSVEQLGNNSIAGGLNNLLAGNLFSFQGAINPNGAFPCPTDLTTGKTISSPGCQVTLPVSSPNFERNNRYNDGAAYVQDSWKVTPKFTANLGIRWEYYGPQHNTNPKLESNFYFGSGNPFDAIRTGQVLTTPNSPTHGLWAPSHKNFAPRVGFAYDPFGNGKWSVRGGYGISYERNFGNVTYNVIQNPPNYAVISLNAPADVPVIPITTNNAGPLAGSGVTKNLPKVSLRAVDPHIKTAYAHQYSFAIEHELLPSTVIAAEYSGSRGLHQYGIANINRSFYGAVYEGDARLGNRLNPQYTNVNFRNASGDSYYNGLNIRLESSNFRNYGIQFRANYTYSHAIDDLSSTFSESGNNFNLGYLDPFNPGLDRGNADFDVRHRLVFSGVWEPTFLAFKNSSKLVRNTLGGWSFAPIFFVRSGNAFTIYDCTNAQTVCPRVYETAGLKKSGNSVVVPLDPTGVGNTTPNLYNYINLPAGAANTYVNPILGISDVPLCKTPGATGSCFLSPAQAGIARNSFRGPGAYNLDLGVYKTLALTERFHIQLRGEVFNILNHHNFYVNAGNADFAAGPAIQTVKGAPGGVPGAGDERRNMQLAVKLIF